MIHAVRMDCRCETVSLPCSIPIYFRTYPIHTPPLTKTEVAQNGENIMPRAFGNLVDNSLCRDMICAVKPANRRKDPEK